MNYKWTSDSVNNFKVKLATSIIGKFHPNFVNMRNIKVGDLKTDKIWTLDAALFSMYAQCLTLYKSALSPGILSRGALNYFRTIYSCMIHALGCTPYENVL